MILRIALIAVLFSTVAARAEFTYLVEEGHWTIGSGKTRCEAMNRPPEEANYMPLNMLFITEDEKRTPKFRVVFWPGALPEKASEIEFTVFVNGSQVFKVPAELGAREWYNISTTAPLPKELLRLLEGGSRLVNMQVAVPGSEAKTVFSLNGIDRALFSLHTCVSALENSRKP